MPSKQFLIWVAVLAPLFTISVLALDALGLSTIWVFTAGIIFGELTDRPMEWLQSWQQAEERTQADIAGNSEGD